MCDFFCGKSTVFLDASTKGVLPVIPHRSDNVYANYLFGEEYKRWVGSIFGYFVQFRLLLAVWLCTSLLNKMAWFNGKTFALLLIAIFVFGKCESLIRGPNNRKCSHAIANRKLFFEKFPNSFFSKVSEW